MIGLLKSMFLGSVRNVSPNDAVNAINAGARVVDVREPSEFSAGAIPNSINVPLKQIQRDGIEALRRAGVCVESASLLLVCRSGARSAWACKSLTSALGSRAQNLAGGLMAWGAQGLPITASGRRAT